MWYDRDCFSHGFFKNLIFLILILTTWKKHLGLTSKSWDLSSTRYNLMYVTKLKTLFKSNKFKKQKQKICFPELQVQYNNPLNRSLVAWDGSLMNIPDSFQKWRRFVIIRVFQDHLDKDGALHLTYGFSFPTLYPSYEEVSWCPCHNKGSLGRPASLGGADWGFSLFTEE